jgi:protein SPT2
MTESERQMEERKKLLLQKVAEKKGLVAKSSTTTSSASTRPNGSAQSKPGVPQRSTTVQKPAVSKPGARPTTTPPVASKPMSYKEKLEMAAKMAAEKQNTGIIQHKAKAPVQEKKEWQKKLEARQQGKTAGAPTPVDRKSKSPGTLSGGEKDTLANRRRPLGKEPSGKSAPLKKSGKEAAERGRPAAKGKSTDKAPAAEPLKRKRSLSPIMSWRGKNAAPPTAKKPNRPRVGGRGRYDEDEDEDDDWIVDDDDDEDDPRAKAFSKKYFSSLIRFNVIVTDRNQKIQICRRLR